jgi:hypothetical protein
MRELYVEGLAIHDGPESCADRREAAGEALTGVHAGRVLSRESKQSGVPTLLSEAEGHTAREREREFSVDPARSETPRMRGISRRENREIPWTPVAERAAGRIGKAKAARR